MMTQHQHTNTRGGLNPIEKRLNAQALDRRQTRIMERSESRKLATMAIGRATVSMAILSRGFFGRLKWLLFGK